MGHRVRVLRSLSPRGLLVLSVAVGIVHGLAGSWIIAAIDTWLTGMSGPVGVWGFVRVGLVVAAIFLAPSVPFAMLIARVHPHVGRLLACASLYGVGCFGAVLMVITYHSPEALLAPWTGSDEWMMVFGMVTAFAMLFAVMDACLLATFALGWAIERFAGKRARTT